MLHVRVEDPFQMMHGTDEQMIERPGNRSDLPTVTFRYGASRDVYASDQRLRQVFEKGHEVRHMGLLVWT